MRKVGYALLVLVALGVVGGCSKMKDTSTFASNESEFKKITPGMDVAQVQEIIQPTMPDFYMGIKADGETTLRWLASTGAYAVQAKVVCEDGQVVSTQWIGRVEPPKQTGE